MHGSRSPQRSVARNIIGGLFVTFVWGLYLVRIVWGTGPMHDHGGNQAPAMHYLHGAIMVTTMVAIWIISMRVSNARRERSIRP